MENNLEQIKNQLLEKRNVLRQRIEKIESSKKRKEPLSADSGEQALELENHEVVDALDELEAKELQKIDVALNRIEKGTYGSCVVCGNMISASRLNAMPYANQCIQCAADS